MKVGDRQIQALALGLLMAACGGQTSSSHSSTRDANTSAIQGTPITDLKTRRPVTEEAKQYNQVNLNDLPGHQIFFQDEDAGRPAIGYNFYENGSWVSIIGTTGNFTVSDKTLVMIDQGGLEMPLTFKDNSISVADEVVRSAGGIVFNLTVKQITDAIDPADLAELFPQQHEEEDLPEEIDGYKVVSFGKLSAFKFKVPDDPITEPDAKALLDSNEIPEEVSSYDNLDVAIRGYMFPLRVKNGLVTEFLIYRTNTGVCCFGQPPRINEWVTVKMTNEGVKPPPDIAIYFFGKFKVGPVLENDYVVSIYAMDCEKIDASL